MLLRSGILSFLIITLTVYADTFTHNESGQVYHGFALHKDAEGKTTVQTTESGPIELDLTAFSIERNATGRNNFVSQITVDQVVVSQLQVEALTESLIEESNKGPLFILLEIDNGDGITPRIGEICQALLNMTNCDIVGFISGRQWLGAQCCGIALALCCDAVYIAPDAYMQLNRTYSEKDRIVLPYFDSKAEHREIINSETYGRAVSDEAWINLVVRIARQKGRPELIARAFFDESLEIWRVSREGESLYIDKADKKETDEQQTLICESGYVLKLNADRTVLMGMADKVAADKDAVFEEMNVEPEKTVKNVTFQTQSRKYYAVLEKYDEIISTMNEKYTSINSNSGNRGQAGKDFRELIKNIQYLIRMKKRYPDVPYTQEELDEFMSNARMHYNLMKKTG